MVTTSKEGFLERVYQDEADKLQTEIEMGLKDDYTTHDSYVEVIVKGEYKEPVRKMVRIIYLGGGWGDIHFKGSSEDGGRGGLTTVKLFYNVQPK